ncbi:MAG: menaquinone biosynthesis decarboxylase [Planctomycetes bacterium]|nr:menaquinone biosynthesis decarboxylase [Planctomycetota bacterium]
MPFDDLKHFIAALEEKGLLKRVRMPVSADLEITQITDRASKSGGPALLFENVAGSSMPVLINAFGSEERMALALDSPNVKALSNKFDDILSIAKNPPENAGLLDKLKLLYNIASDAGNALPKTVSSGPCKDVIVKNSPSLAGLPILKCWHEDGGKFITYPMVFTKDPETGKRNCGIYRMQVFDETTTGMHWHPHKDGARHFAKAIKMNQPLEVAVAIGSDPAVMFSAACPLPPDIDEMILAGLLRKNPVKMIKCETIDAEVPANSEIVLEGCVNPGESRTEGPFGDHTGFYSLPDKFPVFHLKCITHRKNPIYHATVVGRPPMEDCFLGYAIERLFLPLMKMQLPEIVDYHMPFEGVFHNLLIVSIKKQYPGHARKIMHALWGMGQAMFTKVIVVVDEDVNVHDPAEVAWKALNHIDPQRDMEFSFGPMDILDHASRLPGYGSKAGIDATHKWKEEGFVRDWPKEMIIPPEIKAIADKKWTAINGQ